MKTYEFEYCILCDEPTHHAGIHDDSLYDKDGHGPYCDTCYDDLPAPEEE